MIPVRRRGINTLILSSLLWLADPSAATEAGHPDTSRSRILETITFQQSSTVPVKRIRAQVIAWISNKNETTARLSDFLLPGSDLPLRLDIDPGDKEVILEWEFRF